MKENFISILTEKLKEKGLSEGSINLYLRNLKKLNNNKDYQSLSFLTNSKTIFDKIKDLKDNTQRQYLISIVSSLKVMGEKYQPLYKKYFKLMMNIYNKIKDKPTEEMTETQKNNWMNWDDVMKIYKEMGDKLKVNKVRITEEQYNDLLNYVILSLYVLIPPRRNLDWMKMMITFNSNDEDKKYNYLDVVKKQFIFNVFKTSKKDGSLTVNIPDDLMTILNIFIKHHPLNKKLKKNVNIPFLVDYKGNPINKINSITRILNKIFGKKIGASMLRHSYLSNKYGNLLKEQEKDARLMSHNLMTQKDYIKTK
jgi:integrase